MKSGDDHLALLAYWSTLLKQNIHLIQSNVWKMYSIHHLFTIWWEIWLKSQKYQLRKKKGQCKPHPLPAVGVTYCRSVCVFLWDGNVSFYLSIVEKVQKLPDPTAPCLRKYHRPLTVMTDIVTVTAKESWKLSGSLWQVSTNGSIPYIEVSTHHCFNTNSLVRGSSSPDYIIACFPCNVGVVRHTPRVGVA